MGVLTAAWRSRLPNHTTRRSGGRRGCLGFVEAPAVSLRPPAQRGRPTVSFAFLSVPRLPLRPRHRQHDQPVLMPLVPPPPQAEPGEGDEKPAHGRPDGELHRLFGECPPGRHVRQQPFFRLRLDSASRAAARGSAGGAAASRASTSARQCWKFADCRPCSTRNAPPSPKRPTVSPPTARNLYRLSVGGFGRGTTADSVRGAGGVLERRRPAGGSPRCGSRRCGSRCRANMSPARRMQRLPAHGDRRGDAVRRCRGEGGRPSSRRPAECCVG